MTWPIPSLSDTQAKQYLMHLQHPLHKPTQGYLKSLLWQHTGCIPWENLLLWQQGVVLTDIDALIERYCQHQGGLCYQVNMTFAALLQYLGFSVHLHSAHIAAYHEHNYEQPRATHVVPVVVLNNQSWLVDAGWFGLRRPLFLSKTVEDRAEPYKSSACIDVGFSYQLDYQYESLWINQFKIRENILYDDEWHVCLDYHDAPLEREVAHHRLYAAFIADGYLFLKDNMLKIVRQDKVQEEIIADEIKLWQVIKALRQYGAIILG